MRRQVALLVAAVTSLVVLAFLVPLAVLLRNQAENRAVANGLAEAQSLAAVVATLSDRPVLLQGAITLSEQRSDRATSVVLPDGHVIGDHLDPASPSVTLARDKGRSFVTDADGGREVLVAVGLPEGTAVVRSLVPSGDLHDGVAGAVGVLAALGVVLVAVAVLVADRLGRTFVRPVADLARTTRSLAAGDLTARVTPAGPAEVRDVGAAVNQLGTRIVELLDAERETVADLSHRLRTPLTALRLELERRPDHTRLDAGIDALERVVDDVIRSARRSVREGVVARCDAAQVVRDRTAFWSVLVEDQGRTMDVTLPGAACFVRLADEDLAAAVDALIENALSHTPDGSPLSVSVSPAVEVVVADRGPGLPSASLVRGHSGGGSTGLGLDIARRTAEAAGGSLAATERAGGGAWIALRMPPA